MAGTAALKGLLCYGVSWGSAILGHQLSIATAGRLGDRATAASHAIEDVNTNPDIIYMVNLRNKK
jgi:hypothetical protein